MIAPTLRRGTPVVLADQSRLRTPRIRTDLGRIFIGLGLAATVALMFITARHAGAGRAAVFPEGTDTGVITLDMSASISGPTYARVATTLRGIAAANQSVGFVMFSDTAYELLPPNSPPAALAAFIPYFVPLRYYGTTPVFAQSPWDMFMGGTRVAPGLVMAEQSLRRAHVRHGAILIVSDLDDSSADYPLLDQEAVRLRHDHIPVRIVPLFATAQNKQFFAALFGDNAFVDPSVFRHTATTHTQPIAAPMPWTLLGLGAVLILLLAANERWNGRLRTA